MLKDEKHIRRLIKTEMMGNLKILIDPKKKDSFSDSRVTTWVNTVTERIVYHLIVVFVYFYSTKTTIKWVNVVVQGRF